CTKGVKYNQFFHKGYALHSAPWRSSFGYSGSHGCVNMRVKDAKWLFEWASLGTKVVSHR
ncbi:MAG: L,D-transpeptidase, partial [Dermabacter sp.]|nr:L,D-transpeptidase [Dermabacter sp.]